MAITNYSELLAAVSNWMDRDMSTGGTAAECIALAEAKLNRELGAVASTASFQTTAALNTIRLSPINYTKPVSLYMTVNGEERFITPVALGTVAETTTPGIPSTWCIEGSNIRFDCPADAVYPVRFTYEGRFALSGAVPTNEVLSLYPDLYLSASIVWGNIYVRNTEQFAIFKGMLSETLEEAKNQIAQKKRGTLIVDPMFSSAGRYDVETDTIR